MSARCLFSILAKCFGALYVGALILLITVRMGIIGLCSFSCAFNVWGDGFFWIKNLIFLILILFHCWNIMCISFWYFSLLIQYEEFCIYSHYQHKELTPDQYRSENNPMYHLIFDPHITSPPAIHTDQYSDTTNS